MLRELLRRDLAALGPGMTRRNDEHQLVEQPRGETLLALGHGVAADDPEIELTSLHPVLDHLGVRDLELELHAGMALAEDGDDARNHVKSGCRARADQ